MLPEVATTIPVPESTPYIWLMPYDLLTILDSVTEILLTLVWIAVGFPAYSWLRRH